MRIMSLIGLPETFRFAVYNATSITISDAPVGRPTISGRRVRFDASGALSYETAAFTFFSMTSTLGNNTYMTGSTLSNTLSGWLGGEFHASVFASGNASGTFSVFLEVSPDAGVTWPSPTSANGAGGGLLIAAIGFASTTTASTASTTRVTYFNL